MINRYLPFGVKVEQEDTRVYAARQKIKKIFESQSTCLQIRALKPHGANCDPLTCLDDNCFVWQPDCIVSEPYKVMRR